MKIATGMITIGVSFLLSGCAGIDFGDKQGLTYYDPKPYLFVSTTKECVTTATVMVVPEKKRAMIFNSGYGSAKLSATLSSGMISMVGQETDTKIPETISAIAALGSAVAGMKSLAEPKPVICQPTAILYPVDKDGKPDLAHLITLPVPTPIVGQGGN